MIVKNIDVYQLRRLLENESSALRSIIAREEVQKVIQADSDMRKLYEVHKKIRAEIVKIERKG